jgi:hypothetical protein
VHITHLLLLLNLFLQIFWQQNSLHCSEATGAILLNLKNFWYLNHLPWNIRREQLSSVQFRSKAIKKKIVSKWHLTLLNLCLVKWGEKASEEECRACQNFVLKLASEYTAHISCWQWGEKTASYINWNQIKRVNFGSTNKKFTDSIVSGQLWRYFILWNASDTLYTIHLTKTIN